MSSESTTEIVGGIFAEVFKVEDGWAHFEENYANEEGECGKAQFNELLTFFFNSYVNSDDEDENVVKMIYGVVAELGESFDFPVEDNEEAIMKYLEKAVAKLPTYLPIVCNALFRFFDADGSGTISKEELCLVVAAMDGDNMSTVVSSVFRVIDANENGSIEAVEIQPFLVEIITSIAKLTTSIINELEGDIKGAFKVKATKMAREQYDELSEEMPAPHTHDMIMEMLGESFNAEEFYGIAAVPAGVLKKLELFFRAFEEKVATGDKKSLPIKQVAALMASTFIPAMSAFVQPELLSMGADQVAGAFDMEDVIAGLNDAGALKDMFEVCAGAVTAYLKSGALKRFLEALLSFLDVNNDGELTYDELTSFYSNVKKIMEATLNESLSDEDKDAEIKVHALAAARSFLEILDSDGDKVVSMDDFPKIYDKAVEMLLAVLYLQIEGFKAIALSLVMPALNVGMGMTTEDGSLTLENALMMANMAE